MNSDIDLQKQFKEETGKHAIWNNNYTKAFLNWKEKNLGKN